MKCLFFLIVVVACCSALPPQTDGGAVTFFEEISEQSRMALADITLATNRLLVSRSILVWLPIFQHIEIFFNESTALQDFYIKLHFALDFRYIAQYLTILVPNGLINSIEFNGRLGNWKSFLIGFIKLLNTLRQINEANEANELKTLKGDAFLLAFGVREDFRKVIIGEPGVVGPIWSEQSTNAMASHKLELETQLNLLEALKMKEQLLAEFFISITKTTMLIVDQMQICNEILAVKRDARLNDFNLIIFGMDMESIVRRVVTANQLFLDNSDNENLVDYNSQLASIDQRLISLALKVIEKTKKNIDVFFKDMQSTNVAEEIQSQMDLMNEEVKNKRIPFAFETIFKSIATILIAHKDKGANGKNILMYPSPMKLNEYQLVNYIQHLIQEGQLFSPIKMDKENISTQYIHGLLNVLWQHQRSRYIEIQSKIPQNGRIAMTFGEHLKYFQVNESLVGPLLSKIYSMRRAMPKEAYTNVIKACADYANTIEENLNDLEPQSTAGYVLRDREDKISSIFDQIYNQLEQAVVAQWKTQDIFSPDLLGDLFNYSRNLLIKNIYSLTEQNMVAGNHQNDFELVSVLLKIANMSLVSIDAILSQHFFDADDVSTIYQLYFTMLFKDFYIISSVVDFVTEGTRNWEAHVSSQLATIHEVDLDAVFSRVSVYAMSNVGCGRIQHNEFGIYFANWNAYASPISAAMLSLYRNIDITYSSSRTTLGAEYEKFAKFLQAEEELQKAV